MSRWDELLCGVDAAVPHCHRFSFDDVDAFHYSPQLWLAPRRYFMLYMCVYMFISMLGLITWLFLLEKTKFWIGILIKWYFRFLNDCVLVFRFLFRLVMLFGGVFLAIWMLLYKNWGYSLEQDWNLDGWFGYTLRKWGPFFRWRELNILWGVRLSGVEWVLYNYFYWTSEITMEFQFV